jgi:hypothetical protein
VGKKNDVIRERNEVKKQVFEADKVPRPLSGGRDGGSRSGRIMGPRS